jgi:hypothetical protein
MKTVADIDGQGHPARIFHRTATAAWTHAPGERCRYRARTKDQNGSNVLAWIEMRCDCQVSKSANGSTDDQRRSSRPETAQPGPARLQRGGAA